MKNVCRSGLSVLLAMSLFAVSARAKEIGFETRPRPSFDELVADAELIAVVQVIGGGYYSAKVKAIDIIKGKAPSETFTVSGFDREYHHDGDIVGTTLLDEEKVLMFLRQGKGRVGPRHDSKEIDAWLVGGVDLGHYRMPSGEIYGSWEASASPNSGPRSEAKLVIELIRGYVQHRSGKTPAVARKLLDERLTLKAVKALAASRPGTRERENRAAELQWLLGAHAAYGVKERAEVMLAAVRCRKMSIRLAAIERMSSLKATDQVLETYELLLACRNIPMQIAAAGSLAKGKVPPARAVDMLLKALAAYEARVINPLRTNRSRSPQRAIIYALTRLDTDKKANDVMLRLLGAKFPDDDSIEVLSGYFLKHRSDKARDRFIELYKARGCVDIEVYNDYFLAEKSPLALKTVSWKLTNMPRRVYWPAGEFRRFFEVLPKDSPLLLPTVRVALMNYPYRGGIVRECVRVLAGQGSSKSLDAAEAAIIKGGLKSMDSVGEAVRVYVRILGSNHKRVRPFVVKAMKTYKGRQRTHDIVGACIPAACKGLQEMLGDIYLRGRSNWHNAEYNKDVMPSVRLAVQLKLHPLKDPRRNADGWLYLVRRQSSSGYCLDYILDALIAETARETRPYVIEKLRSMTTKGYTNKRLLAVIRALGGSLTPREAKALEKYKRI